MASKSPRQKTGNELWLHLAKRIAQTVFVLFCVATLTFFLVRLTGDPVKAILPDNASLEQETALRAQLGLDQPLLNQYLSYMGGVIRFDFGDSLYFREAALPLILSRLPATIELAAGALIFALIVSIPAGMVAALRRGKSTDSAVVATVLIGQSTPAFFVGIILILIFAVNLSWLPSSGMGGLSHLILPAITLGLYSMAMITRLLRSSLIDVLGEDYIRTARAKGLSRWQGIRDHALKNAALPVVTIVGLEIGNLLGGAILTEQVFSWPGVGRLTVEAITNRDFALIQAIVLFLSLVFVVTNLLVDIAYAFIDPRVRLSK
ncbi:ABC transporter permease [Brevibacterium sp. FME37]|uniref:ABC transporter permease n=1 Tax=Brevibacterium sp. FME37 TaxID=2742607 RepID=UPI001D005EE5|nr:ABC transporter permease [Brevibacterium sp. FME37]